ncbi:MAG: tyrosine-type recombinase/integrase [Chloroflexi bacterium]|uniref:tyrosine-type recombinase/integrase n=1 Tax=Candidatus Flexifilum breve TaxID=3140694 RepID=UPI003136BF46|nr:tyrosine-type recombinase/integrase [Chloroflexota bacterium]
MQLTPLSETSLPETSLAERQGVIGVLADDAARAGIFADYQKDKPANTLRRQAGDLAVFARYLFALTFYAYTFDSDADWQIAKQANALMSDPAEWAQITFGIVSGFVQWQLQQGYAIGSINVRLATVKRYAALAFQAGATDTDTAAKISSVKGFAYGKRAEADKRRAAEGQATRKGSKKEKAVPLTKAQRRALKTQPDTPQGRRDALLICLLLDHGLRCGEIAILEVTAFTFDHEHRAGYFTFYRQKVGKTQTHDLTRDSYKAAMGYIDQDAPVSGNLLCPSSKGGKLDKSGKGMSERAITKRVEFLGRKIGIKGLSAHDGRHSAATEVARRKDVTLDRMVEMFGWNSPAMALTYIEAAKRANEGVDFDE